MTDSTRKYTMSNKDSEFINGNCTMMLFSPKGSIEGAMVMHRRKVVQVTVRPDMAESFARDAVPGKRLRLLAVPDHSPKTKNSPHPVYRVEAMATAAGKPIEVADVGVGHVLVKGTVESVHFARHGQPNGVILKSGEFIHLGPMGMERTGLTSGSAVTATGEMRTTRLGTRLLDAHRVNRIKLT